MPILFSKVRHVGYPNERMSSPDFLLLVTENHDVPRVYAFIIIIVFVTR
jgi:hypothetical protein